MIELPLAIDKTVLPLGVEVSTVDAMDGLGYCETMIFGGEYDQECERTTDRDSARLLHDRVVRNLSEGRNPWAVYAVEDPLGPKLLPAEFKGWPVAIQAAYLDGLERGAALLSECPGLRVAVLHALKTIREQL